MAEQWPGMQTGMAEWERRAGLLWEEPSTYLSESLDSDVESTCSWPIAHVNKHPLLFPLSSDYPRIQNDWACFEYKDCGMKDFGLRSKTGRHVTRDL